MVNNAYWPMLIILIKTIYCKKNCYLLIMLPFIQKVHLLFSIGKLCFEMNITLTNIYACATDEVLAMVGTTNIVINSN